MMLRFLSEADKFAELFNYKAKTASRLDSSQKSNPEKMVHARRSRADLLKKFREIPGSTAQRMRILKEMFLSEGIQITLDRLSAKLQLARVEEKLHQQTLVKRLKRKGNSCDEISSALNIPKSTVARYTKAKKTAKKSSLVLVEPAEKANLTGDR